MHKVLWISWENHRRTNEICDYLSINPYVILSSKKSLPRYFYLIKETIKKIYKDRPRTLLVQNPSIILTFVAVMLRPLFKYSLIVDAHNEAVQPYTHNHWLVRKAAEFLIKYAAYTIVTNNYLAKIIEKQGGRPIVLPDRVPQIFDVALTSLTEDKFNVVLIATYAADEPITQVIDAASALENITLYVTGNNKRLDKAYINSLPSNIIFTGFLSDENYWAYLKSADVIIDLSLKDNCLVCGAYEAVAVATPLILSNNKASVEYFNKGTLFTDNTTDDICSILLLAKERRAQLKGEMEGFGYELSLAWKDMAEVLINKIKK